MINSRDVNHLHPKVKTMALTFLNACSRRGFDVIVTSTYRDNESQNALYAQGRSLPGPKVTNAKGGESFHNYKVALDVVPLRNGKPVWNTTGLDAALWEEIGKIGESCGFEWAGRWKSFKEMAHFQYTKGLTIKDFQSGKTID